VSTLSSLGCRPQLCFTEWLACFVVFVIARKRRLEILEARNVLKQRLESLIDEEKWLLEVAELNERGFAAPSVDSVPAGVLPQQLLQSTMEAGATVAATATSATEQLAKAQQISALLM